MKRKISNPISKFLFTLVLVFTCSGIKANNPGYLGKKTMVQIGYNLHLLMDYSEPTEFSYLSGLFDGDKFLASSFNFNIERVLSKRFMLGVSHSFGRRKLNRVFYEDVYYPDLAGSPWTHNQSRFRFNGTFNNESYNISLKFFSKEQGAISPLGTYFGVNIGRSVFSTSDASFFSESTGTKIATADTKFKFSTANIGMELGANRVFAERFTYSYGVKSSYRLSSLDNIVINDLDHFEQFYIDRDGNGEPLKELKRNVLDGNAIRIFFKVGMLL